MTFGDSCAWQGVGRITVKSVSEAHSRHHVTMPGSILRERKKEWLVTAALHALHTGAYKMYVISTKCNLDDS